MTNNTKCKTQDEVVREILQIIQDNCDSEDRVQSYHDIGRDLVKLGITTTKSRTNEWNNIMDRKKEQGKAKR